jgi:hypothetical protein
LRQLLKIFEEIWIKMIVPTKILKRNDYEIALMAFQIFEEKCYEFHLVKFSGSQSEVLKIKKYKSPIDVEKVAKEFEVKPEDVKELLEKWEYE